MRKMPKIETDRTRVVAVRVSAAEHERLEKAAHAAGASTVTAFVRSAALEKAAKLGFRDGTD